MAALSPEPSPAHDARIAQFRRFVELDPDSEISHFGLAKACFDAGRYAEAIPEYRKCLELKPDYAACFLFLGLAEERAGDVAAAIGTFCRGFDVAGRTRDLHIRKQCWDHRLRLEGKPAAPPPPIEGVFEPRRLGPA